MAEVNGGLKDALDGARGVLGLAGSDTDPVAHTGVLSGYASALLLSCRYEECLTSSETLAAVAESTGLEFALPYAQHYLAGACIGLRRFAVAARVLSTLERTTQSESKTFFAYNLPSQRARLYASVGDLQRALDVLSVDPLERSLKSSRGEFIGWRAVLMAISDDPRGATAMAEDARQVSRDIGTRSLTYLAEAIVALHSEQPDVAVARLQTVLDTGVWDPVVIAIRAAPHVGAFIAEQRDWRSWLQRLLVASRDVSLAASLGVRIPRAAKTRALLSPRESEVHDLLAQGLTNEEIGKLLYISLSTTKVHVKHIYEKLGVRSRLEAARALRDDV